MKKYKEFNRKSGIYMINTTINHKVYIGSAVNIYSRIKDHVKELKRGTHKNKLLQNHYNKYGNVFYFSALLECDASELIKYEQYYIDLYKSYKRDAGFNLAKKAGSMIGFKHSKETKEYWSKKRKGVKATQETKNNMSIAKSGSNHPKSKLTEIDVLEIRNDYDNTRDYCSKKASQYNVSYFTINYILKRKTWKHI